MTKLQLNLLRGEMAKNGFDGYFVPSGDEYLSEYTPAYAKRLEYITGFTGSNGLALILENTVLFFTDGRYITQAFTELDDNLFEVYDQQVIPNFPWQDFLGKDAIVAYDPKLFTAPSLQRFAALNLKAHIPNLVDEIWSEQPAKPNSTIFEYPVEYAGERFEDKIQKCFGFIEEHKAEALLISDPASVCWLLNIRASDVEFSPLLLANMIITKKAVYLFTDQNRFESSLKRDGISVLSESELPRMISDIAGVIPTSSLNQPNEFKSELAQRSQLREHKRDSQNSFGSFEMGVGIIFDENQCSSYISSIIKQKLFRSVKNPCMLWKACKNNVEIDHMKQGHIQDGVAVCEMLSFLSNKDNVESLTEYDIGVKLANFRSKGKGYLYDSFPTICGFQENGAIIHYKAKQDCAKKLSGDGLLLLDSGGQYLGATTDITRVVAIGKVKPEYKNFYTKVLKGHIALSMAKFPSEKVTGANLDVLARQYLWQDGLDYPHGTGHGVGSFLSVHEGPQSISPTGYGAYIKAGMVMSNEPGYYVPDSFGIRIENLMFAKESTSVGFLEFEMLTLVPYAKELIDFAMLSEQDYSYLRTYYGAINNNIAPLLSPTAQVWLRNQIDV